MFARIRSTWRAVTRRTTWEQDLNEELRAHVECRTEDLMRAGLAREEAERQARIELGTRETYKEQCREVHGLRRRGAPCHLSPRTPGDQGRSHGSAEIRISVRCRVPGVRKSEDKCRRGLKKGRADETL